MFVLNSEITIGTFRFSGVHDVVIRQSVHGIVTTATIKIPAIAAIVTNGSVSPARVTTANQFNEGDMVEIKLGYNGDLRTEFAGFVKRRKLDMPLEIECEGYGWLLRKNKPQLKNGQQTIKELLAASVSGIESDNKIAIQCNTDLTLMNITLDNPSGFDIINYISKCTDGNISCFFLEPNILWCGTLYTDQANGTTQSDAPLASYRIGFNTLKKNTLAPHDATVKPKAAEYSRKRADGERLVGAFVAANRTGPKHTLMLNHIKDARGLKMLAVEKVYKNTYTGYEGQIVSFLQPYTAPGHTALVKDSGHPELDGVYLVESTEVHFGVKGARRIVELGPKTGFNKK